MAMSTGQAWITSTPGSICGANTSRIQISLYNAGSSTTFIGPSTIVSGTGYPLSAGDTIQFTNYTGSFWGCISPTGSNCVQFIQED